MVLGIRCCDRFGAHFRHRALKASGFAVQPLVGDIAGGWNMSWYRDTFASKAFADAAVKEIEGGGLEGLNFDYEPHQPGDKNDSVAYVIRQTSIFSFFFESPIWDHSSFHAGL